MVTEAHGKPQIKPRYPYQKAVSTSPRMPTCLDIITPQHMCWYSRLLLAMTALIGTTINAIADTSAPLPPVAPYCNWQVEDDAITRPLCDLRGNAARGEGIVSDSSRGNCIACHRLPVTHTNVFGTIGPSLIGVGSRLNEGQLRLRVTDTRQVNPMSIMPGFYRKPSLINRLAKRYAGRTFLTAQQVEDVVAYLKILK